MYIWTPCSVDLPKETKNYLITRKSMMNEGECVIDIELYSTVYGWCCGGIEVLAWMPLPEPYKDAGLEEEDEF